MKKLCLLAGIIATIGSFAFAQTDDYKKNEYFGGYSNQQIDNGQRDSFNGFDVAYIRNFHRYFGAKVNFSGAYYRKSGNAPSGNYNFDASVHNLLVGVQLKNNASKAKLKPFGHLLAGFGFERTNLQSPSGLPFNLKSNQTGFAASAGGGVDLRLTEKLDLRAIQADYNPMYIDSRLKNNVRLGIGISFK